MTTSFRTLTVLAAIGAVLALPVRARAAGEPDLAAIARAEAQREAEAERSAGAVAQRLERALREARLEAALARGEFGPGVRLTPRALVFVDGPEVPLERIEWTEAVARPIRRLVRTDTLLRVRPGTTLSLKNIAGDIRVVTWDRNEVRIQAEHDGDDQLVTRLRDALIQLGVQSRQSVPAEVEWTLTVPAWLPLQLTGFEGDIDVTGVRSSVRAQTMRGDVTVTGCQGPLQVNTVEGEVHVADVSGNVTAGSVNNVVRLVRVTGPVEAQTINGDIQLEKVQSPSVDASTMNGRVVFASEYQPHGRYVFSSHSGNLIVPVPVDQRVTVSMSSFQGQVESSVPVPAPAPHAVGHRYRFVFDDGVAVPAPPEVPEGAPAPRAPRAPRVPRAGVAPAAPEVALESFAGLIRLASVKEVQRVLAMQRATLDSLRQLERRNREAMRDADRAMRRARARELEVRRQRREQSPEKSPETPPPPPND